MTKLERFLERPPRIRPAVVRKRKSEAKHKYRPEWMPELLKRQQGLCFYCKHPIGVGIKKERGHKRRATLDHVKPVSQQGYNKLENLVAACSPCNSRKGSMEASCFIRLLWRDSGSHPQGENSEAG